MNELSGISGALMDDAQDMMKRLRSGEDGLEYAAADILEAMSIAPVFAALRASEAREKELVEALEQVMIGGNHLALIIGASHPPYTATHDYALSYYGAGHQYEAWCCWRAIMHARSILAKHKEPVT